MRSSFTLIVLHTFIVKAHAGELSQHFVNMPKALNMSKVDVEGTSLFKISRWKQEIIDKEGCLPMWKNLSRSKMHKAFSPQAQADGLRYRLWREECRKNGTWIGKKKQVDHLVDWSGHKQPKEWIDIPHLRAIEKIKEAAKAAEKLGEASIHGEPVDPWESLQRPIHDIQGRRMVIEENREKDDDLLRQGYRWVEGIKPHPWAYPDGLGWWIPPPDRGPMVIKDYADKSSYDKSDLNWLKVPTMKGQSGPEIPGPRNVYGPKKNYEDTIAEENAKLKKWNLVYLDYEPDEPKLIKGVKGPHGEVKPIAGLPDGWEMAEDWKTGNFYYFNRGTGEVTWKPPTPEAANPSGLKDFVWPGPHTEKHIPEISATDAYEKGALPKVPTKVLLPVAPAHMLSKASNVKWAPPGHTGLSRPGAAGMGLAEAGASTSTECKVVAAGIAVALFAISVMLWLHRSALHERKEPLLSVSS